MSEIDAAPTSKSAQASRPEASGGLRRIAYEKIEELLNVGRLKPGQIISQRELVELTGATLGSIREAVPRLEAEGLLITVPKRGLMVPSLDVVFVREAYRVRAMIECAAVEDMVATLDGQTIADWISLHESLIKELAEQKRDVSRALLDRIQGEDWKMHTAIVACMSNSLVSNIYRVNAIKIRMAVQSRLQVTVENASRVLSEHLDILKPLAARDVEETRRALQRHIDHSLILALGGQIPTSQA